MKKPALGYVIKGLRRNTARFDKEGNELLDKDGQPTQAELEAKLNIPKGIEEVTDNELSIPKLAEMQSDPNNGGKRVYTPERKQKDKYHYIRFGHTSVEYPKIIMNGVPYRQHEYRTGHNVYTFYRGIHSAPTLLSGNNVEYIGEWAFLSDVKKNKGKFSVRPDQIPGNSFNDSIGDGDIASATDENLQGALRPQFTSKFNVNFADKTLTGELNYRSDSSEAERKGSKLYDISADINGNRFTGEARTAVNDQSSIEDKAFYGVDSGNLEGGFYGPNGEELAGKFIANDNSLFGVFGAKRDSSNPDQEKQNNTLFDAVYIKHSKRTQVELEEELSEDEFASDEVVSNENADEENADHEDETEYQPIMRDSLSRIALKPLANFGFAMNLRFGANKVDLSKADWGADIKTGTINILSADGNSVKGSVHLCCSNLSYLRFGSFSLEEKAGEPAKALFLQGERTPKDDMPASGKAKYVGTWSGFIQTASPNHTALQGNQEYFQTADMSVLKTGRAASRAEFDVDFAGKSLTGDLTAHNGHTVFKIQAGIEGSGFKGYAHTPRGGFAFDPGNQSGSRKVEISNAEVKGGFYGPDARELGGSISYNSEADGTRDLGVRAAAVFGAVRENEK